MKTVQVDSSWTPVVLCFLIMTIMDSLHDTIGIIVPELVSRRDYNRESVAWITICLETTWKFSACIASGLHRIFGCRVPVAIGGIVLCVGYFILALSSQSLVFVLLFYGVVSGFGMALLFYPTWIVANTYYLTKRQLANGIALSGATAGVIIGAPLVHLALDFYGLQGTFFLFASTALQGVILGVLIPPLDKEEGKLLLDNAKEPALAKDKDTCKKSKTADCWASTKNIFHTFIAVDLLKRWRFSVSIISMFLLDAATMSTIYVYLSDMIIQAGYDSSQAWQPLTVLSATNMFSRLLFGFKNFSTDAMFVIFASSAFILGIFTVTLPLVLNHYWLICVVAAVWGLAKGFYLTLRGPIIAELVPYEDIDRAIGTSSTFLGFSPLLVYPVLGKLFDVTGTYTWTFLIPGINSIAAGFLLSLFVCFPEKIDILDIKSTVAK